LQSASGASNWCKFGKQPDDHGCKAVAEDKWMKFGRVGGEFQIGGFPQFTSRNLKWKFDLIIGGRKTAKFRGTSPKGFVSPDYEKLPNATEKVRHIALAAKAALEVHTENMYGDPLRVAHDFHRSGISKACVRFLATCAAARRRNEVLNWTKGPTTRFPR
jgi:hypothetical protein